MVLLYVVCGSMQLEIKINRGNDMKIGFLNLLTIIFVGCKLFSVIDWSWWLVFAPTILNVLLLPVFFVIAVASKVLKDMD